MAVIESWIKGERTRAVQVQYLQGNLFSADNDGNLVGVEMYDGGEPASLAGSVSANVIRADGTTVAVTGTLSDGYKASVVLPQACYAVPGVISIIIKITDGETDAVTTLGAVVSSVYRSTTDTVVDPGDIIPSVQTLIAAIETAVGSIPADYSSLWTSLAPAYSTSSTYAVGAYVTYSGGLYRCITAITAAESWTAAHWTAAKVGPDLANLKSAFDVSIGDIINISLPNDFDVVSGSIGSDGTDGTNSKRARTSYIQIVPGQKYLVKLTNSAYSFTVNDFVYDANKANPAAVQYLSNNRDEIILAAGENGNYFRASFYYTTNTSKTLNSDDYAAIKAGLKIYEYTDRTVSISGSAADAKATGDYIKTLTGLPAGYQQVEYLESSGAQAIVPTESGVMLDQDSRVVIQFAQAESGVGATNYLFGSRYSGSSSAFYITIKDDGLIDFGYKTKYETNAVIKDTDIHVIDCNKNKFYLDGELVTEAEAETFETPSRGVIFAIYGSSNATYYFGKQKIYRYQQYNNGVLVADCIPCKRLSDNVLGMYNLATGAFKVNVSAGSGAFTAGENVNAQSVQTRLNTLESTISDIPIGKAYIKTEADRVSEKVRNVQTGKSLTFIAVSDMHYSVDSAEVREALDDMSNAVTQIAGQVHIDFYSCFGDIIYRLRTDGNFDKGKAEAIGSTKLLNKAFTNNQQIRMVGNHDPNAEGATGYFTPDQMNAFAGIYSNMIIKDQDVPNGGYGYIDFEKQKIRLIVLNTSYYATAPEQNETEYALGDAQAVWLSEQLDISDKDGYENWQIVVFAHIALDWLSGGSPISKLSRFTRIFNAYETGGSWAVGSYSKSFAGVNADKLALYMNGHQHAYIIKNLDYYDLNKVFVRHLKMANLYVPNALPDRDYAGTDGVVYSKTPNTAKSTAFQVVTLDPVNKVVYAYHYGAGIDMIVHYEPKDVSSSAVLTSSLASPTWNTNDSSIATVSSGTVSAVATGTTMIWAKSTADNCIEAWNINVPN